MEVNKVEAMREICSICHIWTLYGHMDIFVVIFGLFVVWTIYLVV